uniref:Mitochondrial transcription factor 3 n=1 Tax=Triticum aestivum TaxID=4565 RepID=A0A2Z6ERQ5_WHEAT|nr:mitochondrial transcription factor 3 [Triticum aestivum]
MRNAAKTSSPSCTTTCLSLGPLSTSSGPSRATPTFSRLTSRVWSSPTSPCCGSAGVLVILPSCASQHRGCSPPTPSVSRRLWHPLKIVCPVVLGCSGTRCMLLHLSERRRQPEWSTGSRSGGRMMRWALLFLGLQWCRGLRNRCSARPSSSSPRWGWNRHTLLIGRHCSLSARAGGPDTMLSFLRKMDCVATGITIPQSRPRRNLWRSSYALTRKVHHTTLMIMRQPAKMKCRLDSDLYEPRLVRKFITAYDRTKFFTLRIRLFIPDSVLLALNGGWLLSIIYSMSVTCSFGGANSGN